MCSIAKLAISSHYFCLRGQHIQMKNRKATFEKAIKMIKSVKKAKSLLFALFFPFSRSAVKMGRNEGHGVLTSDAHNFVQDELFPKI